MPKKIPPPDPIELKRKNVKVKLAFLSLTAVLLLLTNLMMTSQKPQVEQTEKKEVLGETASTNASSSNQDAEAIKKNFNESLDQLKAQVAQLSAQLEERSTSLIINGTQQVKKQTGDYIYDNTLKPLVNKINDLPDDQKKVIQDAVCK